MKQSWLQAANGTLFVSNVVSIVSMLNIITTREFGMVNAFGRICLCVCLSVCNALNFESFGLESLFLVGLRVHLQNLQVKFVYQIKVQVTGAKKHVCDSAGALPSIKRQSQSCKIIRHLSQQFKRVYRAQCLY